MSNPLLRRLVALRNHLATELEARRLDRLRARGFHLGRDVYFPPSTWVDEEYCHLISIGNSCGFGQQVMLFAHDEAPRASTGAIRIGSVRVHHSSHLGSRAIVLPGVEIGPRTIVAARSVVTHDLPPDTVCAGHPATPRGTLHEYLDRHRDQIANGTTFPYDLYDMGNLTPERRVQLVNAVLAGHTYIVGGRTAELEGRGGTRRTPGTGTAPQGVAPTASSARGGRGANPPPQREP